MDFKTRILQILENDCRLSQEQMALMLGCSIEVVADTIRELEEERIILRYGAKVNWEKVGDEFVTAFIEVKVIPQREVGFDQVAERIYRFPEVRSVTLVSGGYDLHVEIEGKTVKEVAMFVSKKLSSIEHVQSTATHFVLKKYKQDGVIFEDGEEDRRLVVTP